MHIDFPITSETIPPSSNRFTVSEAAQKRIAYLLSDEPTDTHFRIAVLGGGCSGFQYHFDLDSKPVEADDTLIGSAVIDATSLELLQGSQIDYIELLGSAGFEIRNPNATAKCGCGNSFAL